MPRPSTARTRLVAGLVVGLSAGLLATSTTAPTSAASSRRPPQASHFTVSSFNVLGANHTPPGGRRASGATRIVWVNRLLNRHHVDIAGFQELQASQFTRLKAITKGSWGFYPGLRGKQIDSENSIGWRTAKFRLVHGTLVNIPYFDGRPRAMPLVLLRDRRTGMLLYVANYHNPGDTRRHPNQGRWRRAATRVEIALQNQIVRREIPRIMTGDMNERAPFYCRVTARTPLKAARPTTIWRNGVCRANKPRSVDWILGALRVEFSNYKEDRGPLVDRTTDHPVIVSDVTVKPRRMPKAWRSDPPPPVVPRVSY